jgi:hypothetical protein
MVYEYSKQIYLLTNISLWKKSITVQKSLMNVIKNIYIFKKTDKKPKDKKKKKKKDEERDNSSDVQDNNVLT